LLSIALCFPWTSDFTFFIAGAGCGNTGASRTGALLHGSSDNGRELGLVSDGGGGGGRSFVSNF
jgi:hypothetical protein